jgi:xylulose-5-phosphate/fructose-6-phosphate phosphoketolase
MNEAVEHCKKGVSVWDWACLGDRNNPDIVIACSGDTPTLEALACVKILKKYLPKLNVRFINVVDLMKLVSKDRHVHGLSDEEYNELFTTDKPIIFNFHGYGQLIHQLTYNRKNQNIHVRGYFEEGTITTPFDMRVQNKIDRYDLVLLAIKYLDIEEKTRSKIQRDMNKLLEKHSAYIREYGQDMPEIVDWKW